MLGLDWLTQWMAHFGQENGLSPADIARFRSLAAPDWTRPVAPVPPGVPIIDAARQKRE